MNDLKPLFPRSIANLRDLGGLPATQGRVVRSRQLLRSSALVHLPSATLDNLTHAVGQATYVDLRTDREIDRDGGPTALVARGWRWHRNPLRDDDLRADGECRTAVSRYTAAATAVAEQLEAGPVLVACSLGKDRTGMVIALLLHWLGVSADRVAADYAASNAHLSAGRHLLPKRWRDEHAEIRPVTAAKCHNVLAAAPARPGIVAKVAAELLAVPPVSVYG
ncbi:tyrosine-protein phosphatase [Streptomyces sp. NPDC056661]|uniref:tyrosine-protein phosphatase n=1 Tax=Streptomyces sp. NPDC056661 TaxID=3345898 RepID=UPI0036AFAFFA